MAQWDRLGPTLITMVTWGLSSALPSHANLQIANEAIAGACAALQFLAAVLTVLADADIAARGLDNFLGSAIVAIQPIASSAFSLPSTGGDLPALWTHATECLAVLLARLPSPCESAVLLPCLSAALSTALAQAGALHSRLCAQRDPLRFSLTPLCLLSPFPWCFCLYLAMPVSCGQGV